MLDLLIRNGCVVNSGGSEYADIGVKDGRIAAFGKAESFARAEDVIDAEGMYVLPGLIDSHAHINNRQGATPSLDDYHNGSIAAAYGGTTAFVDFPFIYKGETPLSAMRRKLGEAKGESVVDYSFHPCITKADAASYGEIAEMLQDGFTSVKMFTAYPGNLMLEKNGIFEVLGLIRRHGGIALIHAECSEMIERNIAAAIAAGRTLPIDHALCRPPITEIEAMYGMTAMVRDTGAPVIFVHMTTSRARRLLEKTRGELPIFTEVCPHYLTLTEECFKGEDGYNFVCSPPMRSQDDQDGLWSMLADGLVDIVNSDHTDYSIEQKRRHAAYFPKIPNGLPTLETRGVVLYSEGVAKNRISINQFADMTATKIAKLMGMYPRKGVLRIGSDADIAILDPHHKQIHSARDLHMQSDFSPYEGMELTGRFLHTLVRGTPVIRDGAYVESTFRGELIKRSAPTL